MPTEPLPIKRLGFDPLIVLAITLCVFAPVLWTPFSLVDDHMMLVNNPMLKEPSWAGFKHQLTTPQYHLYSPLTYGILYGLGVIAGPGQSMSPAPFKLASWLLHGMSAVAGWWVVWQLCRNRVAAVIGALVVGLHPLQVESVAWTTGLKDVLCGLLSFMTIGLYLRWIDKRARLLWQLSIATSILAALAKPTATVLPVMIVMIDLILRDATWEDRLRRLWPFAAVALASAAIIVNVQTTAGHARAPLWARPLVAGDSYAFYMGKIVWPAGLAVDYTRTPAAILKSGAAYWMWVFPLLIIGGLVATRIRRVWVVCVLFVVPILPVSGLATFDMQTFTTVTDHYVYQSMLGVGLLLALVLRERKLLIAAGLTCMAALSVLSIARLTLWQDMRSLASDTIAKHPRSRLFWESMPAVELADGRPRQAELIAYRALQNGPSELVYDGLAQSLQKQGRLDQAAIAATKCLMMPNDVGVGRARQFIALAAGLENKALADHLARLAVLKWIDLEPNNPDPRTLLRHVEASIARRAATQPAGGQHD